MKLLKGGRDEMNMRYAFLNLCKKTTFTILILIQLVISFLLLYMSISYERQFNLTTERMISVYNNKNLFSIVPKYLPSLSEINKEKLKDFYDYLKSSDSFKYISVDDGNFYINTKNINGAFIKSYATKKVDNENYQLVYKLTVDENFFNKFKFKVSEGTVFNQSDYQISSNKPIPVILGSSYQSLYKLGDTIQYLDYYNKSKYLEVIGFMTNGYYFADAKNPENMNSLDKYIIFPQQSITPSYNAKNINNDNNDKFYLIDLINASFNGFIEINDQEKNKSTLLPEEIIQRAKINDFDVKVISLNETINNFKYTSSKQKTVVQILFIVIFLFTSIGIVTSINYSLLRQQKEFGTHIMLGATLYDIAKRVFYEVFILFSVATISTILLILGFLKDDNILKFNYNNFGIFIAILIVMLICLSILPIVRLTKLSINNIVRREE